MLTRLILILALLSLTVPLSAQSPSYVTVADVTVAGTAVSLFTAADVQQGNGHGQAVSASCSLTGANIRVSYDGVAPTTSLGEVLTPGVWIVTGADVMLTAQGIRDDSTSAVWSCILSYVSGR